MLSVKHLDIGSPFQIRKLSPDCFKLSLFCLMKQLLTKLLPGCSPGSLGSPGKPLPGPRLPFSTLEAATSGMASQWPDGGLVSMRWPFDSQGKGRINRYSQAGTTWEMPSRLQCLPQPFCPSWKECECVDATCHWGSGELRAKVPRDRETSCLPFMHQTLLSPPNIDLNFDFSVYHIACVKPSRKGGKNKKKRK